jgi:hypothetical protein
MPRSIRLRMSTEISKTSANLSWVIPYWRETVSGETVSVPDLFSFQVYDQGSLLFNSLDGTVKFNARM